MYVTFVTVLIRRYWNEADFHSTMVPSYRCCFGDDVEAVIIPRGLTDRKVPLTKNDVLRHLHGTHHKHQRGDLTDLPDDEAPYFSGHWMTFDDIYKLSYLRKKG